MAKTVPNQRIIDHIIKTPCKDSIFAQINNDALSQAARRLETKGGFKLYIYLAKNSEKMPLFGLSSADFCAWSGCGIYAYNSAFDELVSNGYLIKKDNTDNTYTFYDYSKLASPNDQEITIERGT